MPCPSSLEMTTNPKRCPLYTRTPPQPPPRPSLAPPSDSSPTPSALTLSSQVLAHFPSPEAWTKAQVGRKQQVVAAGSGLGHKKTTMSSSEYQPCVGGEGLLLCVEAGAVSPDGKWRRGGGGGGGGDGGAVGVAEGLILRPSVLAASL